MNATPQQRIGQLLTQQALISENQLDEALVQHRTTGKRLGRVTMDRGWVTQAQLAQTLARQFNLPYQDLSDVVVRPEAVKAFPEGAARRMRAMVLEIDPHRAVVAMADPTDVAVLDEVSSFVRRDLRLTVVAEGQLLALIDRSYPLGEDIGSVVQELTSGLSDIKDEFSALLGLGTVTADDAPVVRMLQSVFAEALRKKASDIHIEPQERNLRIRFRIDGLLQVQTEADAKITAAVALRLKLMSGLDISERRIPQDGRFQVRLRDSTIDVRISTMPTQHGESIVMRLLNQSTGLLELDNLHMPTAVREAIEHALARPSGMLLVTGPTGSGKTTTLYASLHALNETVRKIITVEDPVEYRMAGLNQVQVHDKIELGFERVLRAALRQDPDVMLIGEMRDRVTAEVGLRAAMSGHLVLSTLHTNDAVSTPMRLLDMGVPRYMVAMSLHFVLAQRLIRTICTHCAEPRPPTTQDQVWFEAHGDSLDDAVLLQGRGCARCNNTGYRGRTGVYEFLEMDRDLTLALTRGEDDRFTLLAQERMQGNTLRHDAVRLIKAGRTTLHEVLRLSKTAHTLLRSEGHA